MSSPSEITKGKESLLDELIAMPGDFLSAAVKAAYVNPLKGASQLAEHLSSKQESTTNNSTSESAPAFFGLAWHAEQLGGAVGTMVPYFLTNKLATYFGAGKLLAPLATGALMEGILRPIEKNEGDFVKARCINAATGALTFGTLGHLPEYLKGRDIARYAVDQPWLINSFTSDIKRHIVSGAAAGVVDSEARSLMSGHGIELGANLAQSVYSYAALGGLMRGATEVVPYMAKGKSINDIVQESSYLTERARLDPVAKELLIDNGHLRVSRRNQQSSQDIYDLFAHANVNEALELKQNILQEKNATDGKESQTISVADLLKVKLPEEKYPFYGYHPTTAYSVAFNNFPKRATGFLGVGFDSVVLKLEEGGALKISSELRPEGFGERFFDMPILEEGRFDIDPVVKSVMENPASSEWQKVQLKLLQEPNRGINYLIQPEAMTKIPNSIRDLFRKHMPKKGYELWDWQTDQLGYFDGRIVLLDYFAVKTHEALAKEEALKKQRENKPLPTRMEEAIGKR